jgi:hypothetical protein
VAAGLSIFDEALGLEESHQLPSGELGQSEHQGTPTVSSSTCTILSF